MVEGAVEFTEDAFHIVHRGHPELSEEGGDEFDDAVFANATQVSFDNGGDLRVFVRVLEEVSEEVQHISLRVLGATDVFQDVLEILDGVWSSFVCGDVGEFERFSDVEYVVRRWVAFFWIVWGADDFVVGVFVFVSNPRGEQVFHFHMFVEVLVFQRGHFEISFCFEFAVAHIEGRLANHTVELLEVLFHGFVVLSRLLSIKAIGNSTLGPFLDGPAHTTDLRE